MKLECGKKGVPLNKKYALLIMFMVILLGALFICGSFYAVNALGGQQADILAVGEGIIKENNMADARRDAISDALKKGIGQYLSQYLGSQGMAGNFKTLINDIVPFAGEDIENYQILAEDRKGEIYSILVSVKVNERLMEQRLKDFGIVSISSTSIRLLFLVSQEMASGKAASFWWKNPEDAPALTTTELKLYNIFQEQGMEPINRLSNMPYFVYSEDMRERDISNESATKWGRIFSADIIIKGSCRFADDNTVAVDLEAIKVEDGTSICSAFSEEKMSPFETGEDRFINALGRAINNIAVQFGPQLITATKITEAESNKVVITLKEVKNFEELRTFKRYLEDEVGGIRSIFQTRIMGSSITMSVEFTGTKDAFVNKLKGSRKYSVDSDTADGSGGELVITIEHEMVNPATVRNANIQ